MKKKAAFHQISAWAHGKQRRRTSPAAQFARVIADRYLARPKSRLRMFDLVLRRSALGVTIQMNRREGDLHLAPNLRLLMLVWGKSGESTHTREALKPVLRLTIAKDAATLRPRTRQITAESPARDRLLRHLAARRERKESLPASGIRSAALLEQGARAKTPPRQLDQQAPMTILKRFQPPMSLIGPEKRSQQIRPPSAEVEPQQVGRAVKPRPAQAPLDVDVNHLAERVIQAIDRRIIAQRERLGRA